jgi:hypothetical protein
VGETIEGERKLIYLFISVIVTYFVELFKSDTYIHVLTIVFAPTEHVWGANTARHARKAASLAILETCICQSVSSTDIYLYLDGYYMSTSAVFNIARL